MKRVLLYLSFFSCVAVAAEAQKTFEGTVTYDYAVSGSNAEMMANMMPKQMIIKYGKEGMITEVEGGMMGSMMGRVVVNNKTDEAFVVRDAEKAIYVIKPEAVAAAEPPDRSKDLIETDETMDILGYATRKYTLNVEQNGVQTQQALWLTDALRPPEIKAPGLQQMGNSFMANGQLPGFPLRIEVEIPQAQASVIMTASDLNFDKVADSEFEKPAGFTEKDFSQLMQMGNR